MAGAAAGPSVRVVATAADSLGQSSTQLPKDTRYPFPLATLELALQTPPLEHQLGSHVSHLVAHRPGPASEVLSELLQVPQELVLRLIWFGAVYYCPVAPLPQRAVPTEQMASIRAVRKAALAEWGNDSRHQTPRRLSADAAVSTGGYLRAHMHPKRFPAAHSLSAADWARRLLTVQPDHVVVVKPPGLQVPPTVDNVRESLLACVEQALSLEPGSVQPAHRLDAGTEGVVVMARSSAFASYFRELMAEKAQRSVRKHYRCLVASPPPDDLVGEVPLVHWVLEDQRRPGEMAHTVVVSEGKPGALRCELRIEKVDQVQLSEGAAALWGASSACEVTICLVTGRTHQVRVQMAAIGLPLLGDRLYGALAANGGVAQMGDAAASSWSDTEAAMDQPRQEVRGQAIGWCRPALEQQLAPVALQAHSLSILEDGPMGPGPVRFTAGEPWWR